VSDHSAKTYYFDSATSPTVFWVDLNKVDLRRGAKTRTLKVSTGRPLSGEVSSQFEEATPFEFL
jgi:choloylglycine hydrolase